MASTKDLKKWGRFQWITIPGVLPWVRKAKLGMFYFSTSRPPTASKIAGYIVHGFNLNNCIFVKGSKRLFDICVKQGGF